MTGSTLQLIIFKFYLWGQAGGIYQLSVCCSQCCIVYKWNRVIIAKVCGQIAWTGRHVHRIGKTDDRRWTENASQSNSSIMSGKTQDWRTAGLAREGFESWTTIRCINWTRIISVPEWRGWFAIVRSVAEHAYFCFCYCFYCSGTGYWQIVFCCNDGLCIRENRKEAEEQYGPGYFHFLASVVTWKICTLELYVSET